MSNEALKRAVSAPAEQGPGLYPDGLEDLIKELGRFAAQAPPTGSQAGDDSVLLDIEVEGLRCILLRQDLRIATVSLSPREREISRLVAKGYPNKTIAGVLEISSWTVNTHLRRIFVKLAVGSRAAMVAKLHEAGILIEK
jgi:DNA-binding CsgD family transcriptional regulator